MGKNPAGDVREAVGTIWHTLAGDLAGHFLGFTLRSESYCARITGRPGWFMKRGNVVWLREIIDRVPRVHLANLPTPLEALANFSRILNGPKILIKRDDLTGLAFGGNKTRNMEFYFGDALSRGATVIVAGAGTQSNYCRQVAAAASKLGLKAVLVLRGNPEIQGNLLLDFLLGAEIRLVPLKDIEDVGDEVDRIAHQLQQKGEKTYVIKGYRGYEPLAALGYLDCSLELLGQLSALGLQADYIFTSATGPTQAGLLLAAKLLQLHWKIVGVAPIRWKYEPMNVKIARLANECAEFLKVEARIKPAEVVNLDQYVGDEYGVLTQEAVEAIRLLARTEGILLDPVYTGKAMAGLIDQIRCGVIGKETTVVFLHTGGTPALFAYSRELSSEGSMNTPP